MSAVSRPKASSQRSRAASSGPSGVGQGARSSRPPSKGSGVTKRQNQSKSSGDILRAKEEEYRWVGAAPCTSSRFLFICSAALEISVVYMYHICNWYLHHVTHAPHALPSYREVWKQKWWEIFYPSYYTSHPFHLNPMPSLYTFYLLILISAHLTLSHLHLSPSLHSPPTTVTFSLSLVFHILHICIFPHTSVSLTLKTAKRRAGGQNYWTSERSRTTHGTLSEKYS